MLCATSTASGGVVGVALTAPGPSRCCGVTGTEPPGCCLHIINTLALVNTGMNTGGSRDVSQKSTILTQLHFVGVPSCRYDHYRHENSIIGTIISLSL